VNANLETITAASSPSAFTNAAVLSPNDPDIDASDKALSLLQAERKRLNVLWGTTRQDRVRARLQRVDMAIASVVAKQARGKR